VTQRRRLVVSFDDIPDDPPRRQPPAPQRQAVPRIPTATPPPRAEPPPPHGGTLPPAGAHIPDAARYASWGQRVGGALIDGVIVCAALFAIWLTTSLLTVIGLQSNANASPLAIIINLAGLVGALLYAPLLTGRQGRYNGQTLGKQVVGIRVQPLNGGPMTMGKAMLREIVIKGVVLGIGSLCFIPSLLNALWPLWEERRRTLHDLMAGTVVISDK
jgi:uncharacterized RDD family membrane protein YckC